MVIALHPGPDDAWLAEAQLGLYTKASRHSGIMLPIGAGLIAAASTEVPLASRLTWFGLVVFLAGANEVLFRWVNKKPGHPLANLRLRLKIYAGSAFSFLIAWCSMSVFLWVPDAPLNHMMLTLILACSLAGAVAMTSVLTSMSVSMFTTHMSFMLLPPLLLNAQPDYVLSGLTLVYGALLIGQAIALHASSTRTLTLERERAGLVQDLSQAKQQSDRDRAHAAAAGRAKSQFLSNMNHELRTPMNAILGFSELIKTKAFGTDIDKYAEYANIIHDSGQHLLTLINDMLDLAKIEGGRLSLREDEMSITRLLGDVADNHEAQAAQSQIHLVREIDFSLPPLFADERALRQIALNLISNALKFTQPGGTVTMFARTDNSGRIIFGVRDTGIGIAPKDHAQVFERFGRSRHDVTIANQGTGLGLAIVKGFAEAHDGHVRLDSELGKGTTLSVMLPAERARPIGQTNVKAAAV